MKVRIKVAAAKIARQAPWLVPSLFTLIPRKSCTLLKSHHEVNPPSPVSCLFVITCCISDPDQNGGVWVAIFPRYLTLFFFSYFGRSACEHNIQHIFFMSLTIITTTSLICRARRCEHFTRPLTEPSPWRKRIICPRPSSLSLYFHPYGGSRNTLRWGFKRDFALKMFNSLVAIWKSLWNPLASIS